MSNVHGLVGVLCFRLYDEKEGMEKMEKERLESGDYLAGRLRFL